jgi:hypothetical protein
MQNALYGIIPIVNLTLIAGGMFFAFLGLRAFFMEAITLLREILKSTTEFWILVNKHTENIAQVVAVQAEMLRELERVRSRLDRFMDGRILDK